MLCAEEALLLLWGGVVGKKSPEFFFFFFSFSLVSLSLSLCFFRFLTLWPHGA